MGRRCHAFLELWPAEPDVLHSVQRALGKVLSSLQPAKHYGWLAVQSEVKEGPPSWTIAEPRVRFSFEKLVEEVSFHRSLKLGRSATNFHQRIGEDRLLRSLQSLVIDCKAWGFLWGSIQTW